MFHISFGSVVTIKKDRKVWDFIGFGILGANFGPISGQNKKWNSLAKLNNGKYHWTRYHAELKSFGYFNVK
jgi:hypothetical protein